MVARGSLSLSLSSLVSLAFLARSVLSLALVLGLKGRRFAAKVMRIMGGGVMCPRGVLPIRGPGFLGGRCEGGHLSDGRRA